jgi:hypothetical protein
MDCHLKRPAFSEGPREQSYEFSDSIRDCEFLQFSDSVKGSELLNQLRKYQLFKKCSTLQSYMMIIFRCYIGFHITFDPALGTGTCANQTVQCKILGFHGVTSQKTQFFRLYSLRVSTADRRKSLLPRTLVSH